MFERQKEGGNSTSRCKTILTPGGLKVCHDVEGEQTEMMQEKRRSRIAQAKREKARRSHD